MLFRSYIKTVHTYIQSGSFAQCSVIIEDINDGQVILDGLMPGIYYIKEVQAPNGYSIDSELKKVEIKLNQEISLKIKNNKIIIKQEEPQQPIVEIPKLPVTGM